MAVSDWSTTASLNVTIDGINIAEGMTASGVNNAIRAVMAGVADMLENDIPSIDGLAPLASPTFTGSVTRGGQGAFLHFTASNNSSGRVYTLPAGSPDPSNPANGDTVFFYE